jgi:LacI family transcriptional regulator
VASPGFCITEGMGFEEMGRLSARACIPFIKAKEATALCCGDDAVAGFALSELSEAGISVPKDITVTGFDGLEIAGAFHPRLTTLRMPVAEMVDCVGRIISGGMQKRRNVFQMELIEGKSHGGART